MKHMGWWYCLNYHPIMTAHLEVILWWCNRVFWCIVCNTEALCYISHVPGKLAQIKAIWAWFKPWAGVGVLYVNNKFPTMSVVWSLGKTEKTPSSNVEVMYSGSSFERPSFESSLTKQLLLLPWLICCILASLTRVVITVISLKWWH